MKLTNDFSIREAVASDATAIWLLNCNERGYQYPLDDTEQNLSKLLRSNTDKIFVAVYDGSVVGYVHANDYDLLYAPHMKNIMGIAVSSEYKRQGIGSALLKSAEEWALSAGAAAMRLVSGSTRADAHMFYRAQGYVGDKQQINFKKAL